MAKLTVEEASEAYAGTMRNVLPAGEGVCRICKTFVNPSYPTCIPCSRQTNYLAAVVPITYSEHRGQMHTALRTYKDALHSQVRRYAMVRLTAILWRFLEQHEACVARAAGVACFDLVTTVPSSTPERDERRDGLRTMVGWCKPVESRFERALLATGKAAEGRAFDPSRYASTTRLDSRRVLLIDDTWAAGGHAQSAATALRDAGAASVGLVVIGRHLQPEWQPGAGEATNADHLKALPKTFDWTICAVH